VSSSAARPSAAHRASRGTHAHPAIPPVRHDLVCGDQVVSYHELEGMVGGLTRELTARAATRGSRIGVNHAETDMREEIAEAHRVMEAGETGGKLVVLGACTPAGYGLFTAGGGWLRPHAERQITPANSRTVGSIWRVKLG